MSSPQSILCRYFMNGVCSRGNTCQFSHNRSDRPTNICRYYQKGACHFGASCRYDHVSHSSTTSSTTISSSSSSPAVTKPKPKLLSTLRADAPEFIPTSYAEAASGEASKPEEDEERTSFKDFVCPYFAMGDCPESDETCLYTHGTLCDLCGRAMIHPSNETHNAEHQKECVALHEKEMEESFALAQSQDKVCGICMEVVLEKEGSDARFGVLNNCAHIYCLKCIRQWRKQNEQFENDVVRSCPQCRTMSAFVIPSKYWVEEKREKRDLIDAYKRALGAKKCRHFRAEDPDSCPFGSACFYRHELVDGRLARSDSPRTINRRRRAKERRLAGSASETGHSRRHELQLLWTFLQERERERREREETSGASGIGASRARTWSSSTNNSFVLTVDLEEFLGLADDEDDMSEYLDDDEYYYASDADEEQEVQAAAIQRQVLGGV